MSDARHAAAVFKRIAPARAGHGARGQSESGPAGPLSPNPALLRHLHERSKRRKNRAADQITRFAGSMKFVYMHCLWFTVGSPRESRTIRSGC